MTARTTTDAAPAEPMHAFVSRVRDWADPLALIDAATEALDALLGAGVASIVPRRDAAADGAAGGVPVLTPNGVWGSIRLDAARAPRDAAFAVLVVAAQLGVALHAAALAAQRAKHVGELQRRLKEASTLATLSEGFVRGKELGRVLQRVVEGTTELMRCEIATVLLRHPSLPVLEVVAAHGGEARAVLGDLIPIDRSLAGWVAQSGVPRMCMDPASEPLAYRPSGDRAGIRNHLIVPLRGEHETIGVLTVSNRHASGPYTAHETELLGELGRHAQATIESSRVLEALRRKVAESAALAEVGRAVTSRLGLPDVLALVVREAEALIGGECASVVLRVEQSDDRLLVAAASGVLGYEEGTVIPLAGSLVGWVIEQGEAVVSTCVSDDPRSRPRLERFGPGIAVPLHVGSVVRGALVVVRAEHAPPLERADVEALEHLAAYAAVAIENARLHAQTQDRVALLSALLETGNRFRLEMLDVPALLGEIAETVRAALGWRYVVVMQNDAATDTTRPAAAAGFDAAATTRILEDAPTPLTGIRTLLRDEFRVSNSYLIPHTHIGLAREHAHIVTSSPPRATGAGEWNPEDTLVVPIVLGGEALGYISPDEPRDGRVPRIEGMQALELFANQAAIVIDNARLYRAQLEAAAALREQQAELERAYQELRESQEQLLVSEKMAALGRVTAGIAHEINSPLGGILNGLEVVRGFADEYRASIDDPEVLPEDHHAIARDMRETLELTEAATRKVAQFVRSIKAQTRADLPDGQTHFDPRAEIESTLLLLHHHLRERSIAVRTDLAAGLSIAGDPGKFGLVVQNLISNAVDAYDGRDGVVDVRLRRAPDAVVLEVEDHGSGIAEEIRGRIFDYLFTTKEVGRGTGLGLSMVHSVMTSHFRGEIALRTDVGRGAVFVLRFPDG